MKKNSQIKIEKAFLELLENKELKEISVTDLVKKAKINRSTFYVNYTDIYDVVDKLKEKMYQDILNLYKEETDKHTHSYNFLKLFKHIKENQIYYRIMIKLDFDFLNYSDNATSIDDAIKYLGTSEFLEYHVEFFKAGILAIIKKWLLNNCKESPEEIIKIINLEYKGKS